MVIKQTILGELMYATLAAWLVAFVLYVFRRPRTATAFFALGFPLMLAAFVTRWYETGHAPLQNMFEVFLCLGMVVFPLWLFCRLLLKLPAPAINVLVGIIVLFPAGFIFDAEPKMLPPALRSWLFIPHVSAYMLSYIILIMASAQAVLELSAEALGKRELAQQYEVATHKLVQFGFPLLTLGLALGCVWGKLAWGDFWQWDPKELWSLASFLVYIAYLHFRGLFGPRWAWVNSALAVAGGIAIILTLVWVNLDRIFPGMHSYATP
jgi:ABC-type transport system involved in cytochrome c biogenesis permease subunit